MRRMLHRHRWINLLVSGLLLFATSGMALTRMTCLISGHTVMSVGAVEDCCPDVPGDGRAGLRAECCALSEALGADAVGVVTELLVLDGLDWNSMEDRHSMAFWPEECIDTFRFESRPPPVNTTDRLAILDRYLI